MSGCARCASSSPSSSASSKANRSDEDADWMRMVFAALVAAQSMIFGLAVNLSPPVGMPRSVIHGALAISAVVVFLLVGIPLLREAVAAARERRIVIEQLFLAGIGGAFFASLHSTLTHYGHVYYEVVAILLAIYTFGRLLGERRRAAALDAARALGKEFERCERLMPDGRVEVVPVGEVHRGDRVFVAGGAAIPVDGKVVSGCAYVRESALTGESFPVVKREGDGVRAGSYTIDQALVVCSEHDGCDRMLDRLLDLVRSAQRQKSRLQKEADRLVSWFLPTVLLVSISTFAFWTWRSGWEAGVFNALAVLVVACPCSMGLATPIGIWGALCSLARCGLMARDSDVVEHLANVDIVVFDKTGTLGEERMEVVDFVSLESGVEDGRRRLLEEIAAVESASSHPIAAAFRALAGPAGTSSSSTAIELIPGVGVEGIVGGHKLAIGNAHLIANVDAERVAELRGAAQMSAQGLHEVFVLRDDVPVGYAVLREQLRESSHVTLSALKQLGLECVVMTGDTAQSAAVHGFEKVFAEMTPEDKCAAVRELRGQGKRVLFVGDGINDAPAMAEADVAIAVGSGTMLARETAEMELAGVDLTVIADGIQRCRSVLSAIRRNLYFAAGYNVLGVTLAACGIIHPVVAALLMLASSLTVTWQALRNAEVGTRGLGSSIKKSEMGQCERQLDSDHPTLTMPEQAVLPSPFQESSRLQLYPFYIRFLLVLAIAAQGPMLVYLGNYQEWQQWGLIALFGGVAAVFWMLLRERPLTAQAGMVLTMFSFGGVLMLIAWWAEADFSAVVRGGVCLCGCSMSDLGWGLVAKPNWMSVGMIAASIPGWWMERRTGSSEGWICWVVGLVGMLIGMEGLMVLMAFVPIANATLHFFASYVAMVIGMTIGMLLGCRGYRAWKKRSLRV